MNKELHVKKKTWPSFSNPSKNFKLQGMIVLYKNEKGLFKRTGPGKCFFA
jgi:hypothetical protein